MKPHLAVLKSVDQWIKLGCLSYLDRAFVRFLLDQDAEASALVLWAGALVSHQLGRGEVSLDLKALCENPSLTLAILNEDKAQYEIDEVAKALSELKVYNFEQWQAALSDSILVGLGRVIRHSFWRASVYI